MSGGVVSLGSINIDLVASVDDADLADLADRYEWFPEPGETTGRGEVPEAFERFAFETHTGGKGANQAVAAARAGARTTFLGKVGEDATEYGALDTLSAAGVDTAGVEEAPGPTGRAYVLVDETGENRIVSIKGANARVDPAYVEAQYGRIVGADILLLQNELPREPIDWLLSELADEPDRPTVVLDPAPARDVAGLLAHESIDLITPNEVEYEAALPHLDGFDGTVIRTRGAEGVVVENGASFSVPAPEVEAVDTTGAGDTFNGYLGARLAAGDALREAVRIATVAGALSVRTEGAQGSIPTIEEVEAFRP